MTAEEAASAPSEWAKAKAVGLCELHGEHSIKPGVASCEGCRAIAAALEEAAQRGVVRMALCESTRVFLKPQRYEFFVMPGCADCESQARSARPMVAP